MSQFIFFVLFMVTLLAGAFIYFSPSQNAQNPIPSARMTVDTNGFSPDETINRKRDLQVDMKTSDGILQIYKKIDDLTQEQKRFTDMIDSEQEALKDTKQEISDITDKAQKDDQDLLKLKELGAQMQDEESLLVANGRQLVAINDQLTQARQWLNDQNNLVNMSNESSLESLQQHNTLNNGQSSMFIDKIKQQNDDFSRHSQDEQQMAQQRIADEQQRIRDQQNR